MVKSKRPKFTEPNLLILQVSYNGTFSDYASIKTAGDLDVACHRVETEGRFRIVKSFMGKTVVYPKSGE